MRISDWSSDCALPIYLSDLRAVKMDPFERACRRDWFARSGELALSRFLAFPGRNRFKSFKLSDAKPKRLVGRDGIAEIRDARIEQCPPFADQDRIGIPDAPPRCSPISKCNIMNERVLRFDELGLTVGPASCGHEDAHRGTDILKNANMPAKCRRRRRRKVLRTHDFRPFAGDEFSDRKNVV